MRLPCILLLAISLLISSCSNQPVQSGKQLIGSAIATNSNAIVVTANPLATDAGAEVIRGGGSAIDAAIAVQAVLGLVEPQSSGLAGGAFMTYFDNQNKQVMIYDGRELAPESVSDSIFLDDQGESIGFLKAKNSGLSTGIPGVVSLLHMAHQDHGRLDWSSNFEAAKKVAIEGFAISPRLHMLLSRFGKYLPSSREQGPTDAYQYFFNQNGELHPQGFILKNPSYARSLELIAADPRDFYQGVIADQIIEQINQPPRAGRMKKSDLATFSAKRREAICVAYKDKTLCGPPPPSSWLAVAMIMRVTESLPMFSSLNSKDPKAWKYFAEAQRLVYADRDRYVADAEKVDVPINGLLHPEYLQNRAQLIQKNSAISEITAGDPWEYENDKGEMAGNDATYDAAGTTHFVIVDQQGNVVSMTSSVESIFGSTRMAGGMFLNNQLTDFSFKALDEQGNKIANSAEAGKHPRSSMSPTIVLDENGEFLMATGSPGGNSIIAYTAKTLLGILEWGLSPEQTAALPNLVARGDKVRIEKDVASQEIINGLRDYGHQVKESAGENSGVSIVVRDSDGRLSGAADPRREGVVEIID